jgi:hypothetical protein
VRDRSGGVDAEAATGGVDERAPMSGGGDPVARGGGEGGGCSAASERRGGNHGVGGENFGRRRWGALFKGGSGRRNQRGVGGGRAMRPTRRGSGARAAVGPCRPASGARPTAARNRWARATCAVRTLPAKQKGRGEAGGWATATVSGDGAADERGLSGSGRGREGRGIDRWDRPISGRGHQGGCGLHGARVGRPGKEKRWAESR